MTRLASVRFWHVRSGRLTECCTVRKQADPEFMMFVLILQTTLGFAMRGLRCASMAA